MRLRVILAFVIWVVAGVGGASLASAASPVLLQQTDQPFRRGVNVLGYDPYWTGNGERRFQWRHFAEIRKAGFDHVRVNLQAFSHMDAENRLDARWLPKFDEVCVRRSGPGWASSSTSTTSTVAPKTWTFAGRSSQRSGARLPPATLMLHGASPSSSSTNRTTS